ncbi:MAG: hypothetical protein FK732_06825 [Asgard group archaeon]|nr:hypothetical protein [Asgard group archaeon]
MDDWQKICKNIMTLQKELKRNKASSLRFNVRYLGVHEIADQFFCEKQVEIIREQGELEAERRKMGKVAHKALATGMKHGKIDVVLKEIFAGQPLNVNDMLLVAKKSDIPIIGKPDSVFFVNSNPQWLFEYKFSKLRIPPDSSHVQARIYSWLLKQLGFDTSKLKIAIVLSKVKPKQPELWRNLVLHEVMKAGRLKEKTVVRIDDDTRAFLRIPNIEKAEKELDFALGYWKAERNVIPTKNKAKCAKCGYANLCECKL